MRDKCKKYCLGSISDVVREIWWSINNSKVRAHIAPTPSCAPFHSTLAAQQFPHGKSLKEAIFSAFAQTSSEKEDDWRMIYIYFLMLLVQTQTSLRDIFYCFFKKKSLVHFLPSPLKMWYFLTSIQKWQFQQNIYYFCYVTYLIIIEYVPKNT